MVSFGPGPPWLWDASGSQLLPPASVGSKGQAGCPGPGPWDGRRHLGLYLRECGQHWDREKRGEAEKSYDLSYNGTQSLLSIPGDSAAVTVSGDQ